MTKEKKKSGVNDNYLYPDSVKIRWWREDEPNEGLSSHRPIKRSASWYYNSSGRRFERDLAEEIVAKHYFKWCGKDKSRAFAEITIQVEDEEPITFEVTAELGFDFHTVYQE